VENGWLEIETGERDVLRVRLGERLRAPARRRRA
jgi:hypothetical protein